MHRAFLYPLDTFLFAMYCFTVSGLLRSVYLLISIRFLLVFFIVMSAFPLFFIFMSTFRMGWVTVETAWVSVFSMGLLSKPVP